MKLIGLIVNPIAGMGGRVGLKGTDGIDILHKAIQLGAFQEAPDTVLHTLRKLEPIRDELLVLTASGDMGENQCKALGFRHEVVHKTREANAVQEMANRDDVSGIPAEGSSPTDSGVSTDSEDTVQTAGILAERGVELLLFAGGDGTARDIYRAVGTRVPVLGIPAGVKIYSPVYGNTPRAAGELAYRYLKSGKLPLKEEEVVDIDEEAVRKNRVRTELYGYLKVPFQREYLQNKKAPTPLDEEESRRAIALDVVDHMREGEYYLIGPGTTTGAIMEVLGLPNTLLGVDVVRDRQLIRPDCSEKDLLELLGPCLGKLLDPGTETLLDSCTGELPGAGIAELPDAPIGKLVITPTGGQGYLLGRGNQQISPAVLERIGKENILVVATNSKIIGLRGNPLYIDTGSESMNQRLAGYYRIMVGYGSYIMYNVSAE